MSARKIGLLALILALGAVVETTYSLRRHIDIGPAGCRVLGGRFYGKSFRFEETNEQDVPPGTRVEVVNSFGALHLKAGTPGRVRVVFSKTVYLETEEKARDFASRLIMKTQRAGTVLRLFTNRDELTRQDDVGFETSFDLQVPPDTAVGIRNEHGDVDLADVAGAEVENSFGAVTAERVAGPVVVDVRHGNVKVSGVKKTVNVSDRYGDVSLQDIEGRATLDVKYGNVSARRLGSLHASVVHSDLAVEEIAGDLEVRGEHAEVRASQVAGPAQVATTFRAVSLTKVGGEARVRCEHGGVTATGVKGGLWAQTSFGGLELEDIEGPVEIKIEHGGLQGHGLQKGGRVQASGDDVSLDGFQGPLEVEASRGSVHLIPQGALHDPIVAHTQHGGIHLEVPAGSRFELEATARRGEIQVDVPGFSMTRSEQGHVTGRLGTGGSIVRLAAEGGDLSLTARSVTVQGP